MKKLKLSPWHDGSVKPVHVGWYQCFGNFAEVEGCFSGAEGIVMRKWNGKSWIWKNFYNNNLMELAIVDKEDKWRGLLK